jgi:hypothetical protein
MWLIIFFFLFFFLKNIEKKWKKNIKKKLLRPYMKILINKSLCHKIGAGGAVRFDWNARIVLCQY